MTRIRSLVATLAVALAASLLAVVPTAGASNPKVNPDVTVEAWLTGVPIPWDISFTPDGHAIVPTRDSRAIVVRTPGGAVRTIDADLNDVNSAGEGGLMGLVVDPDFDQNRRFYTCQTTSSAVEVVSWRMNQAYTAATRVADPLVGGIDRTSGRHSGCRLRFGYEGYLWIATGDAARGSTPQNRNSLAGKVLRVDPETGKGARGNPFKGRPGNGRIYSYGHRNPQGLDRRPCTSQMWTGEHGPDRNDEINIIKKGGNYGWNPVPGYNEGVPMTDFGLPGRQRGAKWSSGVPTVALSGIGWITGADWGAWDGDLAGATLKNQRLMVFEFRNNNSLADIDIPAALNGTQGRLRTAVMGPDGSLYVTSDGAGAILRVTPDPGPAPSAQDIDGNGVDDLVVGIPGESVRSNGGAGAFQALYGHSNGLSRGGPLRDEARTQRNIKGSSPEAGDALGSSVAYGDIDGDGRTDVVVGSPGEAIGPKTAAGAIHVICGRTFGLEARASQTFSQAGSVKGKAERGDRFGAAVAVGDFDGDGYDDVAAGAPDEDLQGRSNAGIVTLLYGTSAGITTEHSASFSQADIPGAGLESGDRFGSALAVGDFDNDGYDDLAVGAPGEDTSQGGEGAFSVLFGSEGGLSAAGAQHWTRATATAGGERRNAALGTSMTSGDFDNDGFDDLGVGAPNGASGDPLAGGEALAMFGSAGGLTPSGASLLGPADAGGASGPDDRFGEALTAADFDGDGFDELVAGSPGHGGVGRIVVYGGGAGGLSFAAAHSQAGPVVGQDQPGDDFGAALATGDFDGNGFVDLAVGVPGESFDGKNQAGRIAVLQGSAGGIVETGSRSISQRTSGIDGKSETGDRFGAAL